MRPIWLLAGQKLPPGSGRISVKLRLRYSEVAQDHMQVGRSLQLHPVEFHRHALDDVHVGRLCILRPLGGIVHFLLHLGDLVILYPHHIGVTLLRHHSPGPPLATQGGKRTTKWTRK